MIFAFFTFALKVNAASWTIVSSKSKVNNGESFSVTIKGNDVGGKFGISVTNGRANATETWKEDGENKQFTVTANGSGQVHVVVSTIDCYDTSGKEVHGTDDVYITINSNNNSGGDGSRGNSPSTKYNNSTSNNENLSDNNYLKSLSVDNGTLSPKFDKKTKEYTLEIDPSVEKIKINAEAEDKNAKIEGLGEKEIKEATSFQIAVTAENGKVNTYTLKISYKDEHPITVKIGKKTYTVVKRKSLLKEFDDYKFTMIKINGIEVPALYNKTTKLTLVGLTDGDKIYLYRYDKKNNTYVKYIEYDFKNVKLVLFDLEKKMIPNGYEKYTIKINDYNTKVYKLRKSSKYSLIYGMNVKTGEKSLYLHDSKENTVQRYTTEASEKLERENDKYYKMCIALCGGIALLIILLLIVITMKDKTKKKAMKIKKKLDNEDKKEKISKE